VHDSCKFSCRKCGNVHKRRPRCPHDEVTKISCQICSPHNFCVHNHMKHRCRKCGNSPIKQYDCEYNRPASRCRKCRGETAKKHTRSRSCEHNVRKQKCQICFPLSCIHNRLVFSCTTCKGDEVCEHYRVKYKCKQCPRSGEALAAFNASKTAQEAAMTSGLMLKVEIPLTVSTVAAVTFTCSLRIQKASIHAKKSNKSE